MQTTVRIPANYHANDGTCDEPERCAMGTDTSDCGEVVVGLLISLVFVLLVCGGWVYDVGSALSGFESSIIRAITVTQALFPSWLSIWEIAKGWIRMTR